MQSENLALSQGGNSSSFGRNMYNLYKYPVGTDFSEPQTAASVSINKRIYTLYQNNAFNTIDVGTYVDENGLSWGSTIYRRPENFTYRVDIQNDGRWGVVFEGRMPLGDVLRLTDVEYDDGTPIDYVPEWGKWGVEIRLQASVGKTSTLPNGAEATIHPDDVIYAVTYMPAGGAATSGANGTIRYIDKDGKVVKYQLSNTVTAATKAIHGKATVGTTFWMNPVHFLGAYDPNFNYDGFYSAPTDTLVTSSRVTRTRGPLTSAVRGTNTNAAAGAVANANMTNRVAAATKAAVATGDNLSVTLSLSAAMILCAAAAVVIVMKKRGSNTH